MNFDERQYERIARYLDGAEVTLSADELSAAEQLRRDEAFVAERLDVGLPQRSVERAWRRLEVALTKPRRLAVRFGYAAAVAATVVIAASAYLWVSSRQQVDQPASTGVAELAPSSFREIEEEFGLPSEEVEEFEADILLALATPPEDLELDAINQAVEEFWVLELSAEPLGG